ncbi:CAP domain-containing protein [Streptacidiphilus jiangxiensis]|uniref:Uncharacterized conserved protein YkwD, contains CAP (CSP/antigen 5/PR1) domain n=1 Tax=Streptacidiphilus jiangxiensis TaxID=235985 RepID=A0A1H7SK97_STRJI|nr:CAP domain-containing protein [Streptacidiphilus jiangxiensis]SEL72943.1 Uncharacterized conserved protein YkwD, contains CAP (CSP/antigen 5/PR1) domain [Streptacidiphilus jiangxiensis]
MDWQAEDRRAGDWRAGEWQTDQRETLRRAGNRHRKRRRGPITPLVAVAAVVCAGSVGAFVLNTAFTGPEVSSAPAAPTLGSAAPDTASGSASASTSASSSATPSRSARPTTTRAAKPSSRPSRAAATPTQQTSTQQTSAGAGGTGGSVSVPSGAGNSYAVQQVLAVINQARAQAGLPAYTLTDGLTRSAGAHNAVMMGGCGLSHQCPGEADLGTRITDAGVQWGACGENIGEGGPQADTDAAIASMAVGLTRSMLAEQPPDDGHRRNILSSSFRHIGIVVQRTSDGTVYMTQDFSD